MSTLELIVAVVVALGALAGLWVLLKGRVGGIATPLTEEELKDLEDAVILLADDSVTIQKVVELSFMDAPVRVVCASDGKSATDLLENERFDVVIADVHMPARNGYEVCEYAKKLHPGLPVLLLIGAREPFDKELYNQCGADEHLKKPFDSAELPGITSRLLRTAVPRSGSG